ncbi:MAG: HlyD family efflux transporter periplasmic adaptor subunit [Flammeovirgaceae bacterium]|nr:HlyD family efflux transporter periplasmic adaptor subunit [Flammeovirgaceae bacterium]
MKIQAKYILLFALAASACSKPEEEESTVRARVSVQVVELNRGVIKDELTFSASTLYLKRNVVSSPIPSFVTQVFIKLGEAVKEGQVLYQLETKEARALGSQAVMLDSSATSFGKIIVRAPASGIISTLDKQQIGDYVLEGGQLCTIAESDALAFAVNVPFEFSAFAKAGMKCSLILPDNSVHAATLHYATNYYECTGANANHSGQIK